MSGYDWEPEQYDAAERAREWDRADNADWYEQEARDRLERDVGENRETRMPLADGRPLVSNVSGARPPGDGTEALSMQRDGKTASVTPSAPLRPTMHEGEA